MSLLKEKYRQFRHHLGIENSLTNMLESLQTMFLPD